MSIKLGDPNLSLICAAVNDYVESSGCSLRPSGQREIVRRTSLFPQSLS